MSQSLDDLPLGGGKMRFRHDPRKKWRNVPCLGAGGEKFDSKHERAVYEAQKAKYKAVLRQVSIPLGQGVRMRIDSMTIREVLADGWFVARLTDAKGKATREWINKAKWLFDKYGLEVIQVKRGDDV